MLDGVMLLWFILTAMSVLYVAIDIRTTPEAPVMKWGFVILTLFSGPLGAFFYVLGCREPLPGTHEQYISAPWRQVLGSTMHCAAGDGLGILVGAVIASILHVDQILGIVLEYVIGFAFGWAFFQAYAMKDMAGGDYFKSLKMTFIPELFSMNCLMAGMILLSRFWMPAVEGSDNPLGAAFWFIMSMSLVVGFLCAYPMNWWLVTNHLKHGMMTVRANPHVMHSMNKGDHKGHEKADMADMAGMDHSKHDMKDMAGMDHSKHDMAGMDMDHDKDKDSSKDDMAGMPGMAGMKHDAGAKPGKNAIYGMGALSIVILGIAVAIVLTLAPAS